MMLQRLRGDFFPKTYIVTQRYMSEDVEGYIFELLSTSRSAKCPECGMESKHTNSYQERTVRDLPILGKPVTLKIAQKRYFCGNEDCKVEVFTERTELANPYFHFTERCREYMLRVAAIVNCEAASKILAYQGIKVSGDTLLNMLKAAGEAYQGKPSNKIGVDDWAYRKGREYGTLICDLETHEIIDVLKGRDKETFEKWLRGHPGIEIVSRDRASAYASAVNSVLPEAVQIADRFHITKNLLEALENTMKTFMPETVMVPNDESTQPSQAGAREPVKKTLKRSTGKPHK